MEGQKPRSTGGIAKVKERRIIYLSEAIEKANDSYYNGVGDVIDDELYDSMKNELKTLDPDNPILFEIGAKPKFGALEQLPYYMGSLNKVKDDPKVLTIFKKSFNGTYTISDKLDGNSALIVYDETGNHPQMYSRGNGIVGQNISKIIPSIKGIPEAGTAFANLAIRGELIISRANWQKLKAADPNIGANARNVVAGAMNAKKPRRAVVEAIEFVAFEKVAGPEPTRVGALESLTKLGFNVVRHEIVAEKHVSKAVTVDALKKRFAENRESSMYDIDGIVVEATEHKEYAEENPIYAFAFKKLDDQYEAQMIIKKIEWNVSKDGYIKPTVVFQDVHDFDGFCIARATGFNAGYIKKNVLGTGAEVFVIRSGDVIPHIVRVIKPADSGEPELPKNMEYTWTESGVDIVATDETSSVAKRMEHFVKAIDMKGLGPSIIEKLVGAGFNTIPAILALKKEQILMIDGFKEKSAENILAALRDGMKRANDVDVMVASNIFGRGIGKSKLALVIEKYPRLLLDKPALKLKDLTCIKGLGDSAAASISSNLQSFYKFQDSIASSWRPKADAPTEEGPKTTMDLAGVVIVFSGFRNKDWEEAIQAAHGTVSTTVSNRTNIVVANDPNSKSEKVTSARNKGIDVISKEEFAETYLC